MRYAQGSGNQARQTSGRNQSSIGEKPFAEFPDQHQRFVFLEVALDGSGFVY
jgi:hypothetical protein